MIRLIIQALDIGPLCAYVLRYQHGFTYESMISTWVYDTKLIYYSWSIWIVLNIIQKEIIYHNFRDKYHSDSIHQHGTCCGAFSSSQLPLST